MNLNTALLCIALPLGLAACQPAADPGAERARQAAATEQAAADMAGQFEQYYEAENWQLAKAHGDVLLAQYPESGAAASIKERHVEASSRANEAREAERTAALWAYQREPQAAGGAQISAAIYARDNVKTDDTRARPVRLIFRDHPEWGTSAYLTLETGDFDCYSGCDLKVTLDDAEPVAMDGSRPDTDEAIAMFIEDEKGLWRHAIAAEVLSIEFPVKAGGTRIATFETQGLDPSKLPEWPQE